MSTVASAAKADGASAAPPPPGVSAADALGLLVGEYARRHAPPSDATSFERTMLEVVRGWASEHIRGMNLQTYHVAQGSYLNRRYLADRYKLGSEVALNVQPYPTTVSSVFVGGESAATAAKPGGGFLRKWWPAFVGAVIGSAGIGGLAVSILGDRSPPPVVAGPDAGLDLRVR